MRKRSYQVVKHAFLLGFLLLGFFMINAQEYATNYNAGVKALKEDNLETAKSEFEKAREIAQKEGNEEFVTKSNEKVARVYYNMGTAAFEEKDYEGAVANHQAGIDAFAEYMKNHYGKAKALVSLGKEDEAIKSFEAAINGDEEATANASKKAIKRLYYKEVGKMINMKEATPEDVDQAITALDKCQELVGIDANGYYYYALAYQEKEEYEKSIKNLDEALALMAEADDEKKAKFYYAKGKALYKLEDLEGAKAAFEGAAHGRYQKNAKTYIERITAKLGE